MAGENSLVGATGYDIQYYKITQITYGTSPVYTTAESANFREIYFYNNTQDDFTVTFEFSSWDDYNNAGLWFANYCFQVANPNNTTVAQMAVWCPVRNFARYGYPKVGMSNGDQVGELTYIMNISFVGTLDPTAPSASGGVVPAVSDAASAYFYPTGTQANGLTATDAAIYDAITSGIASIPTTNPA